jgi:hypothetical protein
MVTFPLALGAVRAVIGEPWLSVHSASEPADQNRAMADLVPASLVASLACSLVMLAMAVCLGVAVRIVVGIADVPDGNMARSVYYPQRR